MHGIMEFDKGYVEGTTWHGMPQYIQLDRPVTIEEAREVMCYPIRKEQLFRVNEPNTDATDQLVYEPIDAWCIARNDHHVVLVPHVGSRFVVLDNSFLLDFVNEHLLGQFKELVIESVGTIFNGATAFVNLKIAEFQIKGDTSPTISRLMYYNPLGRGCYQACAHDIRIVCNNTLRAAEAQGATNKTLAKFRHTASAGQKINGHLEHLAEVKLGLEKHVEKLEFLASKPLISEQVEAYLDKMFPLPTDDNGKVIEKDSRAKTIATNKREDLMNIFHSDQGLTQDVAHSAYGLLQATTNYFDHGKIKGGDDMACRWDGIVGQRAAAKDTALKILLNV